MNTLDLLTTLIRLSTFFIVVLLVFFLLSKRQTTEVKKLLSFLTIFWLYLGDQALLSMSKYHLDLIILISMIMTLLTYLIAQKVNGIKSKLAIYYPVIVFIAVSTLNFQYTDVFFNFYGFSVP